MIGDRGTNVFVCYSISKFTEDSLEKEMGRNDEVINKRYYSRDEDIIEDYYITSGIMECFEVPTTGASTVK